MTQQTRCLTIIGGGPAGIQAALSAASHLEHIRLVSAGAPGDWSKFLPSRVWLAALEDVSRAERSPFSQVGTIDLKGLANEVNRVSQAWYKQVSEQLSQANVEVIEGIAAFRSSREIEVENSSTKIAFETGATLIASGAEAAFPSGFEPDSERVFSPATISQLKTIPESILVIGDACIGFEFVDIFSRLDVKVQWIVLDGGPRSGFSSEIDKHLLSALRDRGVEFFPGPPVSLERGDLVVASRPNGSRFEAEAAFVNIGHRPSLARLNLAAAGVSAGDNGMLQVDEYFRTNVPHVYAVGDALRFWAGNVAMGEAQCAALHASHIPVAPFDHDTTIISFGFNPQAAKVGNWDQGDPSVRSSMVPYSACLMAHIERQTEGFVRIAWNEDGRILGGHAVGANAADVLAPVAMTMKLSGTVTDLASMSFGHPYYAELTNRAVQQ